MLVKINTARGPEKNSIVVSDVACSIPVEIFGYAFRDGGHQQKLLSHRPRYGQKKTVHVWRFVTADTIEEKIASKNTGAASSSGGESSGGDRLK